MGGQMRQFIESQPEHFIVTTGEGRKYTVAMHESDLIVKEDVGKAEEEVCEVWDEVEEVEEVFDEATSGGSKHGRSENRDDAFYTLATQALLEIEAILQA